MNWGARPARSVPAPLAMICVSMAWTSIIASAFSTAPDELRTKPAFGAMMRNSKVVK